MELYDPNVIRYIKNRFGFRFSKSLGQNFLTDKSVIDDIADGAMVTEDDLVIEIGPGIGVLTQALLERAGKVVSIEIDRNLIEVLALTLAGYDNFRLVSGDVLKTDLPALIEEEQEERRKARGEAYRDIKIVGNLPYYITTPILTTLLQEKLPVSSITAMMQKEVADRIACGPGSRDYGALSVAVQYYSEVVKVREVPRTSFMPQPKVDSEVLRLDLLPEPRVRCQSEERFFKVVRAGFSQRRKTLLNSLGQTGYDKTVIRKALEEAEIPENARAEALSLEEFSRLADAFSGAFPG